MVVGGWSLHGSAWPAELTALFRLNSALLVRCAQVRTLEAALSELRDQHRTQAVALGKVRRGTE